MFHIIGGNYVCVIDESIIAAFHIVIRISDAQTYTGLTVPHVGTFFVILRLVLYHDLT